MSAQRKQVVWEDDVQWRKKTQQTKKTAKGKIQSAETEEKSLNNKLRTKCIILFCVVSALAIFFILRSGVAASSAYNLNQMKREATVLEAENARLHLDIAHLKSPERIQSIAANQLGMILPDKFFFSTEK